MKFVITAELLQKYPNHKVAIGLVSQVSVFGPNEQSHKILTTIYPEVVKQYTAGDLSHLSNSVSYKNLEKQIHSGRRFGFPHDQIQRVLSGKEIHNINNVVNTYMKYELSSNLSFSAYDFDSLTSPIEVTLNSKSRSFRLLGGIETEIVEGDLIFTDEKGVFYSFMKGYADRTKITTKARNIMFTIDAPEGIDSEELEKNMRQLCEEFNSANYFVLSKENPEISVEL